MITHQTTYAQDLIDRFSDPEIDAISSVLHEVRVTAIPQAQAG
nr:hypothetical protein [Candidatus Frankia nodulisporulans]